MIKTILIIEDEEVLASFLKRKLLRRGYRSIVAADGKEGLEKIKEIRPDLILLDVAMPKMDGFEVMEAKDRIEEIKDIPIIIISNSGQPVEISRAQKLGAKDWIIKTNFDPEEVVGKVEKILPLN
jgi:DNA-binding response OmpR family regulator